ncbi:hypothetical protein Tco_0169491 [Tanacetum coccineum]
MCSVHADVKTGIMQLMSFQLGTLPIMYLSVPLISSRLLYKDCKILVECVRKRIGDWKNKWLSFVRRRQLVIYVFSSMHLSWASVFILLAGIIHDIEQLMCGFLWYQRDIRNEGKRKCLGRVCAFRSKKVVLSYVYNAGYSRNAKVKYILSLDGWTWPMASYDVLPVLNQLTVSTLYEQKDNIGLSLSKWNDIVRWLLPLAKQNNVTIIVARLILATSSYFVWQERNNRVYGTRLRTPDQFSKCIVDVALASNFMCVVVMLEFTDLLCDPHVKTSQ